MCDWVRRIWMNARQEGKTAGFSEPPPTDSDTSGGGSENVTLAKAILVGLRPFFELPEWDDMTDDQREHFREAAGDAFAHVWLAAREEALDQYEEEPSDVEP